MKNLNVRDILTRLGIEQLNEMQQSAVAAIKSSKDVLLLSPTGSGKTVGFLLPIFNILKENTIGIRCLIIVPSRELALQIEQVWKKMATGYKVNSFYGGHDLEIEINNLSVPPALLIGTPGRIADHLTRNTFSVDTINTLVLDEFDKSLSLGFEEEMSFIIGKLTKLKKRILTSATEAITIPTFTGVDQPVVINYISENTTADLLKINVVESPEKDKINTLLRLLSITGDEATIIFCNHREATERTGKLLEEAGIENVVFHGGLEQPEREQALARFRNGSVHFLVATDLAARGLDIPAVKHIIHYHLPGTEEEFIHRNGRTARMNETGNAYIILHQEEHLPSYVTGEPTALSLPEEIKLPAPSAWTTIYISGGKKDKINKIDIVGFFSKIGGLAKEDLGMIDVKDYLSYAAVKKNKVKELLHKVQDQKMKGNKYRIAIAR